MVTNETLGLLFQFGLFLVALIGLVVTLTKRNRPPLSSPALRSISHQELSRPPMREAPIVSIIPVAAGTVFFYLMLLDLVTSNITITISDYKSLRTRSPIFRDTPVPNENPNPEENNSNYRRHCRIRVPDFLA